MTIKFLYIRQYESNSEKIRRVATIARKVDLENQTVSFAVAISNPCDVFKKSVGRTIATARLAKKPITISLAGNRPIEAILAHIQNSHDGSFPRFMSRYAVDELVYRQITLLQIKEPSEP